MRCTLALIPLAFYSSSVLSQEANNPFEFQEEKPVAEEPVSTQQQVKTIVQAPEDLSRTQREEVLLLLAEALEKAAVAGGQGVYQIDGFKRYFVIEDDDVFLGMMNDKFIIQDTSRNIIEYVKSTGYMGVVSKQEWTTSIQSIVSDLTEIERKTLGTQAFVDDENKIIENAMSGSKTNNPISVGNQQSLRN